MTSRELYQHFLQRLKTIYPGGEAMIITDWAFEKLAGLQRFDITRDPNRLLAPDTVDRLSQVLQELLDHRPIQYVLGEALFYHMKLFVNEEVLVPRPETEELVQLIIGHYSDWAVTRTGPLVALDIGTGSGCIAIALKKHLPGIAMHAIDISVGALSVAGKNAAAQGVDIEFTRLDFLDEKQWTELPAFDLIVSNPPYIPLNEKEGLDKNVREFEPPAALFVPDNTPLLFYEKIAAFGKLHLRPHGKIYVELHENYATETAALFAADYLTAVRKDLFGKERMLMARRRDVHGN